MTEPAVARPKVRAWKFLAFTALVGFAALFLFVGLFLSVVFVVTLPLLPRIVRRIARLAAAERQRLGRYLATPIPSPPAVEGDFAKVMTSSHTHRDIRWLALQGSVGMVVGSLALASLTGVLQNLVVAVVWPAFPGITTTLEMRMTSWGDSGLAVLTAAGYAALGLLLVPPLARWYSRVSAARLAPPKATLVERLAEVTATRAAALEAHGAELRRIERNLHDGTQNRLVAVVMHLGMVERALKRDPAVALPMVLTAQNAATDALAELREVVRAIYPPVLADRGLSGAVASLVSHCAIPCTLDEQPMPRLPAAVEAAAYFVVAEALTNAVKHSGAERITVSLRTEGENIVVEVTDDGHGGADEAQGSGLVGIRRRIAAFDGRTSLVSPLGGPTVLRVDIPAGP
ncbi:sensor histidine kinase [Amycolatopsis sp.]|uniref:sensor histidine kinase n=1 Tax=Amycolatopsis sp. TaxID=37632 RepID=UPI002E043277|nr:sensor domain-containing protein [Amycolatopsis sp.]